ncbi:MAG: bifunctional diaminohydroxyphosphoribosylaminopyrimidine deaminase/5-amino-6-(5-phosphoribosylamino)uracil reductase RibD [Myxococcota bacterium]
MSDRRFMDRALALAATAMGTTAPNPPVGAVIVRDDAVIGEGFTQPIGGAHAEVRALGDAAARGHDVVGATMYVTLEPCCHHGRTPPCSQALIRAGIGRVVVGVLDPYEKMQGRSVEELRAAGLTVDLGVEGERAAESILGFARAQRLGLPEVTAKAAISLDGRIATAGGESQWITGEAARVDGHRLRAHHDAILVGIGTVLADDPRLTVRLPEGVPGLDAPVPPTPVVLDTELRIPADARLFATRTTIVLCAHDAPPRSLPGTVVRVDRGVDGHLDVTAAMRALVAHDRHRILVEGGAGVHRALIDAGLVDTLHVYVAGTILAGGKPWIGGPALAALSQAPRFALRDVRRLDADVRLTYGLRHGHDPDAIERLVSQAPSVR